MSCPLHLRLNVVRVTALVSSRRRCFIGHGTVFRPPITLRYTWSLRRSGGYAPSDCNSALHTHSHDGFRRSFRSDCIEPSHCHSVLSPSLTRMVSLRSPAPPQVAHTLARSRARRGWVSERVPPVVLARERPLRCWVDQRLLVTSVSPPCPMWDGAPLLREEQLQLEVLPDQLKRLMITTARARRRLPHRQLQSIAIHRHPSC